MRMIGLLGGVASGKSFVAKQLESLGAGLLDADRAGHDVLRTPRVEDAARERWGREVFSTDGRIDRIRLAGVVFADSREAGVERRYLEKLTHPLIRALLEEQKKQFVDDGRVAVVLDAPLLLEAGWDGFCDILVLIETPRELRLARSLDRGWSEEDFDAREDAQKSLDLKCECADVKIDNSGSPEQTEAQVERFWHTFVG